MAKHTLTAGRTVIQVGTNNISLGTITANEKLVTGNSSITGSFTITYTAIGGATGTLFGPLPTSYTLVSPTNHSITLNSSDFSIGNDGALTFTFSLGASTQLLLTGKWTLRIVAKTPASSINANLVLTNISFTFTGEDAINPNTIPEIIISDPTNNSEHTLGDTIILTARATDQEDVRDKVSPNPLATYIQRVGAAADTFTGRTKWFVGTKIGSLTNTGISNSGVGRSVTYTADTVTDNLYIKAEITDDGDSGGNNKLTASVTHNVKIKAKPIQAPNTPTGLKLSWVPSTSTLGALNLLWTVPTVDSTGGVPTSFDVQIIQIVGGRDLTPTTLSVTYTPDDEVTTAGTSTNLKAATNIKYKARVRATNNSGSSAYTAYTSPIDATPKDKPCSELASPTIADVEIKDEPTKMVTGTFYVFTFTAKIQSDTDTSLLPLYSGVTISAIRTDGEVSYTTKTTAGSQDKPFHQQAGFTFLRPGTYNITGTLAHPKCSANTTTVSKQVIVHSATNPVLIINGQTSHDRVWIQIGDTTVVNLSVTGGTGPYNITKNRTEGTLAVNKAKGTGTWTFKSTKASDFTVTFTIEDDGGATDTNTFQVITRAAPGELTLQSISDRRFFSGTALSASTSATGGVRPYTFTLTEKPTGATLTSTATRTSIKWIGTTPGTHTITVKVTDSATPPSSVTTSFDVVVIARSYPLRLGSIGNITMNHTDYNTRTLGASGGTTPYRYSITGKIGHIRPGEKILRLITPPAFAGQKIQVQVTLFDATNSFVRRSFVVTVGKNAGTATKPPVLSVDSKSTLIVTQNEGATIILNSTNPKNQTLEYRIANRANYTGWQTSNTFNVATPTAGTFTHTYQVVDEDGLFDELGVSVRVGSSAANPPVMAAIADITTTVDTDIELTVVSTNANHATPYRRGTGDWQTSPTFTWSYDKPGTYIETFTTRNNDTPPLTDSETVTITVEGQVDPLVITEPVHKSERTINFSEAISIDIDASNGTKPYIYSFTTHNSDGTEDVTTRGTLTGNTWTYTAPAQGEEFYFNVFFFVTDSKGIQKTSRIKINVTSAVTNNAPILSISVPHVQTVEGTIPQIKLDDLILFAYGDDPDDTDNNLSIVKNVKWFLVKDGTDYELFSQGTVYVTRDGVHYNQFHGKLVDTNRDQIDPGYNGLNHTFKAVTTDNAGIDSIEVSATIVIFIPPERPNQAPEFQQDGVNNTEPVYVGQKFTIRVTATDPDGDKPVYSYLNQDVKESGGTINARTGEFSWTPKVADYGTHDILFVASDGELTDEWTLSLTVKDAPDITPATITTDPVADFTIDHLMTGTIDITINQPPMGTTYTLGVDSHQIRSNTPDGVVTVSRDAVGNPLRITDLVAVYKWDTATITVPDTIPDGGIIASDVVIITVVAASPDEGDAIITTKTIRIGVRASTENAPVLTAIGNQITQSGVPIQIPLSATDPTGSGTLKFSHRGVGQIIRIPDENDPNTLIPTWRWIPEHEQTIRVTFTVTNTVNNLSDSELVIITVQRLVVTGLDENFYTIRMDIEDVEESSAVRLYKEGKVVRDLINYSSSEALNQITQTIFEVTNDDINYSTFPLEGNVIMPITESLGVITKRNNKGSTLEYTAESLDWHLTRRFVYHNFEYEYNVNGNIITHMNNLVNSMNTADAVRSGILWSVGDISTDDNSHEVTLEFRNETHHYMLTELAKLYNRDFWVEGYTIYIGLKGKEIDVSKDRFFINNLNSITDLNHYGNIIHGKANSKDVNGDPNPNATASLNDQTIDREFNLDYDRLEVDNASGNANDVIASAKSQIDNPYPNINLKIPLSKKKEYDIQAGDVLRMIRREGQVAFRGYYRVISISSSKEESTLTLAFRRDAKFTRDNSTISGIVSSIWKRLNKLEKDQ